MGYFMNEEIKTKYSKYKATYDVDKYKNRTYVNRTNTGKNNSSSNGVIVFAAIFFAMIFFAATFSGASEEIINFFGYKDKDFVILSTYENKDMEDKIVKYGKDNGIDIEFKYAEDLDAVSMINQGEAFDAIWSSNSTWLYQVDKASITNSKSISINPVVLAVKESKAKELGLVNKDITNKDIVELIKNKKIKYVMSSVVRTNSGASAYLNFLNSLAGSPEVLTSEMLKNQKLKNDMITFFSGVERVSGTDTFLEDMFLKSDDYEAVIAAETSLIRINQKLVSKNKEPLYLLYPTDGVAIGDSPFAYVDRNQEKKDYFEKIQNYLLSDKMQKELSEAGRRTWYGGISSDTDKKVFNPEWGIDTTKYLNAQKYPSKDIIKEAQALYVDEFRKPGYTVFLLDYSGSMSGSGIEELKEAMSYILDYDEASKDLIQFGRKDKIYVIPFNSGVITTWYTDNGRNTANLYNNIALKYPNGGTNIYEASIKGLELLDKVGDNYTKTIILMTDGQSQPGINSLRSTYYELKSKTPIYSITFGDADTTQLNEIASLTNAKVFDGKTDLLKAFKEVRSFN